MQRFRDLIFEDSRSLWLRPQGQRAPQSNVYILRSHRAQLSAGTLHCTVSADALKQLKRGVPSIEAARTTSWCEVVVVPITPRAPASQRLWPRPVLIAHAFDFLFRGFNFVVRLSSAKMDPSKISGYTVCA